MNVALTIIWGDATTQENLALAKLLDLSTRGARFRVPVQVPRGAWLVFNTPRLGAGGRGTVRYCRLVKGQYEIGVEFFSGTGWASPVEDLNHLSTAVQTSDAPETVGSR